MVFTSFKDDAYGGDTNGDGGITYPSAGDWSRIQFSNVNPNISNTFDYALLRYGGYGANGMLWVENGADVTVRHVLFEHSRDYGLYIEYDSNDSVVLSNTVHSGITGAPASGSSDPSGVSLATKRRCEMYHHKHDRGLLALLCLVLCLALQPFPVQGDSNLPDAKDAGHALPGIRLRLSAPASVKSRLYRYRREHSQSRTTTLRTMQPTDWKQRSSQCRVQLVGRCQRAVPSNGQSRWPGGWR